MPTTSRRCHEKSPNVKGPNEKSPSSPKLKNAASSGPDSPPQSLGIENIALDRVVRLGWVSLG